jgi:hypothetical protein
MSGACVLPLFSGLLRLSHSNCCPSSLAWLEPGLEMLPPRPCNVLMIYPRFGGGTFWNFAAACELFNAHYPTAPLGLITVAALLPTAWTITAQMLTADGGRMEYIGHG